MLRIAVGSAWLRPAIQSSHPLESNQDLPDFSRTPRPARREWDTSRARLRRAQQIIVRLSESGRTSGLDARGLAADAPRATMDPRDARIHPSRFVILLRYRVEKCLFVRGPKRRRAAQVSPAALPRARRGCVRRVEGLRDRYPTARRSCSQGAETIPAGCGDAASSRVILERCYE